MDAATFVKHIQNLLEDARKPEQAERMQAYMKNQFVFLGIKTPERKLLIADPLRSLDPSEALHTAQLLWTFPEREFQYVGLDVLEKHHKALKPTDLPTLRQLIQSRSWWDTVDALATKCVGMLVLRHPELRQEMDLWTEDENMWIRRTALLHQLKHRRKTDSERLFAYCLKQANDPDFFIRKAMGWALREYAKTRPEEVQRFVEQHQAHLSGLTVREALKHFD